MNEDQLQDLKQFIATTISQSEARLMEKLEQFEQKTDASFANEEATDENIAKLEQKAA